MDHRAARVAERFRARARDERGAALILVLLLSLAVAAIALGAGMVSTNAGLIDRYGDRHSVLSTAADAGLEEARSRLNGDGSLYPDTGYTVLEQDDPVYDADGNQIPDVRRSTYAGPTGITTGQIGVNGSIVVVTEDAWGNRLVRRGEIWQENFAKYAFFVDEWDMRLGWARGHVLYGPVHSNQRMRIWNCCGSADPATFHGPVSVVRDIVEPEYGIFKEGYEEGATLIPMPNTADLNRLQTLAAMGNMSLAGGTAGSAGEATLRIEFVTVDLNGDGEASDAGEGFFRVYRARNDGQRRWVVAGSDGDLKSSENCGDIMDGRFLTFDDHPAAGTGGAHGHDVNAAIASSSARCHLGGSDILNADGTNPMGRFMADDGKGEWLRWTGAKDARLPALRDDADYLFPLARRLNPNFKGVIHVDGKVAISGEVRGQVTVAATDNLILADDLKHSIDPGDIANRNCADDDQHDMLGMFSGEDVVLADNLLNSPQSESGEWHTLDDTKDEWLQGVLLTLDMVTNEHYASGARTAEPCEGQAWGRGCLYLTGGRIQRRTGAMGTLRSSGGTGHMSRITYDECAADYPPPYYPTTDHFIAGRVYEVDPTDFDIDSYWSRLVAGS